MKLLATIAERPGGSTPQDLPRQALVLLARHDAERSTLATHLPLVPLGYDLPDFLKRQGNDPARRAIIAAARQTTLVRLPEALKSEKFDKIESVRSRTAAGSGRRSYARTGVARAASAQMPIILGASRFSTTPSGSTWRPAVRSSFFITSRISRWRTGTPASRSTRSSMARFASGSIVSPCPRGAGEARLAPRRLSVL